MMLVVVVGLWKALSVFADDQVRERIVCAMGRSPDPIYICIYVCVCVCE